VANELINRQAVIFNGSIIGYVFADVPDMQKKPPGPGPFVQVPAGFVTAEIGSLEGLWWRVSPFNATPWAVLAPVEAVPLPDGFEAIFGPRPHSSQFRGGNAANDFQIATVTWESNLNSYVSASMPANADAARMNAANDEAVKYDMGEPAYYENKYGFRVRFPDSQDPDFEATFDGFVISGTGQIISAYQNRLTNAEVLIPLDKLHPFFADTPGGKEQRDMHQGGG